MLRIAVIAVPTVLFMAGPAASMAHAQNGQNPSPPCELPNPGDPQEEQDCKFNACAEYLTRNAGCWTLPVNSIKPCLDQSRRIYIADMSDCENIIAALLPSTGVFASAQHEAFTAAAALLPESVLSRWDRIPSR